MRFKLVSIFLVGLSFFSCAEGTINISLDLTIPNTADGDALSAFIASNQNGAAGVRFWYTYKGLVNDSNAPSNVIAPIAAAPEPSVANANILEWSTALSTGTSYVLGEANTISLTGIPLGKQDLVIALEVLQRLSDGKIHPVAFYITQPYSQPMSGAQLQADLTGTKNLVAGRTCGDYSKAINGQNAFSGTLESSRFIAICQ